MKSIWWKAAGAALWACACGPTQTRLVLSVPVKASQAQAIVVSASQEPSLAGAELDIPAGALAADTTITLELGLNDVVESPNKSAGPVAIWGPSGTKFSKPALMKLPFHVAAGQSPSQLFIDVWEADGTHTDVGHSGVRIDSSLGLATFNVTGFTSFQPGTASGNACQSDADCQGGDVCLNGVCEPPDDGGIACICPNGQVCDANGGCNVGADAGNPDGGACNCPAGQTCGANGTCIGGNDAGPGDAGISCGANSDCQSGDLCCPFTNQCYPANNPGACEGNVCQSNADCPSGQVCENGVCSSAFDGGPGPDAGFSCNTNADCPSGEVCLNGICEIDFDGGPGPDAGVYCTSNADCPNGDVCLNGVCEYVFDGGPGPDGGVFDGGASCQANADCPSGEVCENGVCESVSDAGPGPDAGASCTTDTDCQYPDHCINGVCQ